MTLPAGTRLGPYEILSPIGAGGMGEVYRARDSRLCRDVAVKVLPQTLATDSESLARFEREALAVAALSHPNILAIHDFGSHEGVAYAVMELLQGETLRETVQRGPIPPRLAVGYALQIARGLSAAHAKGVVHRDLKPENLFLTTDGHLKILDFGLAKRVEPVAPGNETSAPTASGHTQPGTVMGTVGYMSPEQVRGLPVDQRSDIFTFGAILYELLSGRRAFQRETAADTMAAILKEEPPEFGSGALERIVRHCLEKNPERRFHSVHDLVFDLENPSGAPVLAEVGTGSVVPLPATTANARPLRRLIHGAILLTAALALATAVAVLRPWNHSIATLAVLPIANAGTDANADYLGDGITDALIESLARLPNLTVRSRDSVARFRGLVTSAQAAGAELKVEAVLKGSFVQRAEDLLITAELVRVRDNSHLWGGQFRRRLADIQAVQEEMAGQVSATLRAGLTGAEKKQLTRRYTQDPEAYQLYLKGRYFWEKRTEGPIKKSIEYFDQAIEKDPSYALAYSGLSASYAVSAGYSVLAPRDAIPKSRGAAERALEIDDGIAQAHATLGWSLWSYDWNYPAAEEEFKKAIALDRRDPTAPFRYGILLMTLGRSDEAIAQLERAREIAPLQAIIQAFVARAYLLARQYDRTIEEARKTPDNFAPGHARIADAYAAKGSPEKAARTIEGPQSFWAAILRASGIWGSPRRSRAVGPRPCKRWKT